MENLQTLVILDFGSQYTQLIARKTRELGVYSIVLPYTTPISEIKKHNPKGIILSGGPNSVNAKNSPQIDVKIFNLDVPVLGVCYGLQLLAKMLGGKVSKSDSREYGLAKISAKADGELLPKKIFVGNVWMSHGDHVSRPPKGFEVTAKSGGIISVIENSTDKIYGLQFHPEVSHTDNGQLLLKKFVLDICNIAQDWTAKNVIKQKIDDIKHTVKGYRVICALSGGVDSSVAATLVNKAIADKQLCVFVDTGLLRENEYEDVLGIYKKIGLNVKAVDAKNQFLTKLKGVQDPEKKRKIIGNEFIKIFDKEADKFKAKFLVQGTLYPDVIESVSVHGPSVTIKSHHNVGGLPKDMKLKLIEPLNELFKDEVRNIGKQLGLPDFITQRQPFPGPGLAIRIIDDLTEENLAIARKADLIVREEIEKTNEKSKVWQYFAVLLPIKTVGVMGDQRSYERVVAVRCISSVDGMTADWAKLSHGLLGSISTRIVNEVEGVNRVVYDITSKPPGTIEWE